MSEKLAQIYTIRLEVKVLSDHGLKAAEEAARRIREGREPLLLDILEEDEDGHMVRLGSYTDEPLAS